MGKFEFRDRHFTVDICGMAYAVDTSEPKNLDLQEKAANFKKIDKEDVAAQIRAMVDMVNTILGPSATDTIFAERAVNLPDLVDLFTFLTNEINQENARRAKAGTKQK